MVADSANGHGEFLAIPSLRRLSVPVSELTLAKSATVTC